MEKNKNVNDNYWFNLTISDLKKIMAMHLKEGMLKDIGGGSGLLRLLHSHKDIGLEKNYDDIEQRSMHFGENYVPPPKKKRIILFLVAEILEPFFILTMLFCLVSILVTHFLYKQPQKEVLTATPDYARNVGRYEELAILCMIFFHQISAGLIQYNVDRKFARISEKIEEEVYCNVIRSAEVIHLLARYIVTGDIVVLKPGDIIYADGILVDGSIEVKEPPIREDHIKLIEKNEDMPFLFSETEVMEGDGKMLVICVGSSKANMGFPKEDNFHPSHCHLRARLFKFMLIFSHLSMVTMFGVSISMLTRYMFENLKYALISKLLVFQNTLKFFIYNFVFIVAVSPSHISRQCIMSMMFSVKSLMKENIIVKDIKTLEILPTVTSICTNKTGSITSKRMTVVECFISGSYYDRKLSNKDLSKRVIELLEDSIGINTNYGSNLIATKRSQLVPPIQVGNKTECALLGFLADLKINYLVIRKRAGVDTIIKVFPTNSKRRIMTTLYSPHPDRYLVLSKGNAPDVLANCKYKIDRNDDFVLLTDADKKELQQIMSKMTNNSLRTLAMAIREISLIDKTTSKELLALKKAIANGELVNDQVITKDMVILAIFGLEDPLRPDVKNAIDYCEQSGIMVRMLTEDSTSNARSIALKCGIYKPWRNHVSLDRNVFNDLVYRSNGEIDQASLQIIIPYLKVLARILPEDKLLMMDSIKRVAMYDDKVEVIAAAGSALADGTIMHAADIGFALGHLGTETTKKASNILLLTDSFIGILRSIMWGRNINDTLLGIIHLKITFVITTLITLTTSIFWVVNPVLKSSQILYLYIIIDLFLSSAILTQTPTTDCMKKAPYKSNRALLPKEICRNIFFQVLYQLIVINTFLFTGTYFLKIDTGLNSEMGDPSKQFTMLFHVFFLMTMCNALNARMAKSQNVFRGLKYQKVFILVWLLCLLIQLLVLSYGRVCFYTTPLLLEDWLWCLVFGLGSIIWHQITSMVPSTFFCRFKMEIDWDKVQELAENDPKQLNNRYTVGDIKGGKEAIKGSDKKQKSSNPEMTDQ